MDDYKPITKKEALENIEPRLYLYYEAYRRLGGRLKQAQYRQALIAFLYHTFDAFVGGWLVRYPSREAAFAAFSAELRRLAPRESPNRIFESVDTVDPYT